MTIPGLRDRAEPLSAAARILAGHETQVAGELRRPLEATPVHNLRREHHRRVQGDPAEALPLPHHRGEGGQLGQPLDLPIHSSRRCSLYMSSA